MSSRWTDRVSQALGLRLAAWYLGIFLASTLLIGGLTYGLLATLLESRDHDIIQSTLREYATRYQAGGLPALARAIEIEQRPEQAVGEEADHQRAGEEGAEIPGGKPEAERLADAVSQP